MLTIFFWCGMLGYGAGYEGYENGKWKFGLYTPTVEYGWVVTEDSVYLDTIFEKTYFFCLTR